MTTTEPGSYVGTSRIVTAAVMGHLATIHVSPDEVIGEYVENSGDAIAISAPPVSGGFEIYVVFEPDGRMWVVDNAHGMIPDMLTEDAIKFAKYQADLAAGTVDESFQIKDQLRPFSLSSLRWFGEHIGSSGKTAAQGSVVRGRRGIGALGFRSIADKAIWYSRPNAEMAKALWGNAPEATIRPAARCEVPTASALLRHDMRYTVAPEPPDRIHSPFGKVYDSGTIVEISGIDPESARALRPGSLAESLRKRFGDDVAAKRYALEIVDRVTEEGRKTRGGRRIPILPPVRRGIPIVERAITIRVEGISAAGAIDLLLDQSARGERPRLRFKGDPKGPITAIKELDKFPWNMGRLVGTIDVPDLPETIIVRGEVVRILPWTTDKRTLLPSPGLNHLIEALDRIAEEFVIPAIREIEQRISEQKVVRLAQNVGSAAASALQQIDVFKDLTIGTPTPPKGKGKKPSKRKPDTTVVVFVKNEHRRGVAGIPLKLSTIRRGRDMPINILPTGEGGKVSFGTMPEGLYRIVPDLPEGVSLHEDQNADQVISITQTTPGAFVVFQVKTGAPAPLDRDIPHFNVLTLRWSAIEECYSLRRLESAGILEVNTAFPPLRAAIDNNNEVLESVLLAQIVGTALTQFSLRGDPQTVFFHQLALIARIMENLQ